MNSIQIIIIFYNQGSKVPTIYIDKVKWYFTGQFKVILFCVNKIPLSFVQTSAILYHIFRARYFNPTMHYGWKHRKPAILECVRSSAHVPFPLNFCHLSYVLWRRDTTTIKVLLDYFSYSNVLTPPESRVDLVLLLNRKYN
jgi:hypothetical protein